MKRELTNLMLQAGAFAPFRLANRSRTLILTYHRFSRDEEPDKISSSSLERHLDYLQSNYRLASLTSVSEALGRGLAPPPGTAVITIDDGYSDAYEVAFPILRKYGVPATLFVVTGFVDRKTWMWTDKMRYLTFRLPEGRMTIEIDGREIRFSIADVASRLRAADSVNGSLKKLPNDLKERTIERLAAEFGLSLPETPPEDFSPVTWEQTREMDAQGVEIGSHTLTHPILTNIGDTQLGREMRDSKSRLEEILDREVPHFCYPNGAQHDRVRQAVADSGYRSAVSTINGLNDGDSPIFALRRISAEPEMVRFVQCTSGFEQLKARLRHARSKMGVS